MSPDLTSVSLTCLDEDTQITRTLRIQFPPSYPNCPLSASHQLPKCWEPPLTTSLLQLYSCWEKAESVYSMCWLDLRELDRLCWVLDPDMPGPRTCTEDWWLPPLCLHQVVDPSSPSSTSSGSLGLTREYHH